MIIFVWAQDRKGLIGQDGRLPWHLTNDLKFFKELTMGNTMVMGRKTFEGMGKRLLPGRHTIVLTSQEDYDGAGAELCHDPQVIIEDGQEEDLYVIGGADLFRIFQDHVQILYRTFIDAEFSGDTFMPELKWEDFLLVKSQAGDQDEKNPYPHRFEIFQRRSDL